jgi:hypothetical protein
MTAKLLRSSASEAAETTLMSAADMLSAMAVRLCNAEVADSLVTSGNEAELGKQRRGLLGVTQRR